VYFVGLVPYVLLVYCINVKEPNNYSFTNKSPVSLLMTAEEVSAVTYRTRHYVQVIATEGYAVSLPACIH